MYVREHMKDVDSSAGKLNVAQATKELSSKWRALSEAEKQVIIKYVIK